VSFETYLLLLPSGAGGHSDDIHKARSLAASTTAHAWIFGCRYSGHARGRYRPKVIGRAVELTLAWTHGQPDQGLLLHAMEKAGVRHGLVYYLADTKRARRPAAEEPGAPSFCPPSPRPEP
jgi:hypothetical protein